MINMLLFIYRIIMAFLSAWIMRNFFILYYKPIKRNKNIYIFWIPYLLLQINASIISSISPFLFLFCNIISIYFVLINIYAGSRKRKLLYCIAIQALGTIIEILISFLFNQYKLNYIMDYYLGTTLSNIMMFSITVLLKTYIRKEHDKYSKLRIYLLIMPIGSIVIAYNIYLLKSILPDHTFISIISYCLIILINLTVFEVYDRINFLQQKNFENYIYEQQLDMNKKHIDEIELVNRNLRTLEHDINNHLNCISMLLNKNAIEDAKKYINSLHSIPSNKGIHINSGNPILDCIIETKSAMAKELKIDFRTSIFIPNQINVDDKTISIILGNSLDNALEAASKCKKSFIELSLIYKKGSLIITISNTFNGNIIKDSNGEFITTKDNSANHGLGIKSIKMAIESYDGEIVIKTSKNIFTTIILLNLVTI